MPNPEKAPAVIFVTDRLKDKPSDAAEQADADDKFQVTTIELHEATLLFKPPLYRPIEPPAEIFTDFMKRQKFIVAVHR